MERTAKYWAFAVVISLVAHAGLVAALLVALPAATLPKPSAVGPPPARVGSTSPIPVRLLGSAFRTELVRGGGVSEASETLTTPHPRRRARAATLKAKTNEADAEAHSPDVVATSNSNSSENAPSEFSAAQGRASSCCSAGASSGAETGPQATGFGVSGRVEELHRRLSESAQRCYPSTARRLRLHGEVGLHFCLSEQGRASVATLRGSTGSALLDAAARECVLAGALPAPGIAGCYDVPIKFSDRE